MMASGVLARLGMMTARNAWLLLGLGVTGASAAAAAADATGAGKADGLGLYEAFSNSFLMIIVTELGDKTFFIAALLSMRHGGQTVFAGAAGALAVMTALSALMGMVLPSLLPRQYTHWAAVGLFVYFGVKLLLEAIEMVRNGTGMGASEELEEVEKELKDDDKKKSILMQAFTLTFLAEWGDRSQIATIALAAAKDPMGVTLGGILGHCCCTGLAVLGGKAIGERISERVVIGSGGVLFLLFAAHGAITGSGD
mmetsp:Transcript_89826/g.192623  ORF Transcript_89826/g.192623 Transcript_89826/m.192623 type:complete len:254 (-) Transcript_89826:159-920(-)